MRTYTGANGVEALKSTHSEPSDHTKYAQCALNGDDQPSSQAQTNRPDAREQPPRECGPLHERTPLCERPLRERPNEAHSPAIDALRSLLKAGKIAGSLADDAGLPHGHALAAEFR